MNIRNARLNELADPIQSDISGEKKMWQISTYRYHIQLSYSIFFDR